MIKILSTILGKTNFTFSIYSFFEINTFIFLFIYNHSWFIDPILVQSVNLSYTWQLYMFACDVREVLGPTRLDATSVRREGRAGATVDFRCMYPLVHLTRWEQLAHHYLRLLARRKPLRAVHFGTSMHNRQFNFSWAESFCIPLTKNIQNWFFILTNQLVKKHRRKTNS